MRHLGERRGEIRFGADVAYALKNLLGPAIRGFPDINRKGRRHHFLTKPFSSAEVGTWRFGGREVGCLRRTSTCLKTAISKLVSV